MFKLFLALALIQKVKFCTARCKYVTPYIHVVHPMGNLRLCKFAPAICPCKLNDYFPVIGCPTKLTSIIRRAIFMLK